MADLTPLIMIAIVALVIGISLLAFARSIASVVESITGLNTRTRQYIQLVGAGGILMAIVVGVAAFAISGRN